jgi:hypothetical protein
LQQFLGIEDIPPPEFHFNQLQRRVKLNFEKAESTASRKATLLTTVKVILTGVNGA